MRQGDISACGFKKIFARHSVMCDDNQPTALQPGQGTLLDRESGLVELRRQIDAVDRDLLVLLNRRARISLEVGRLKAGTGGPVFRPQREQQIMDALAGQNPGPLPNLHLRAIWREIFASSRTLQGPVRVAYLGPEGTHSHFAAVGFLGQLMDYQPCVDFREIFASVQDGRCALGVVPLENSLHGSVVQNFDLFTEFDVYIQAEFMNRIQHCLLSQEASLETITTVYSHPQALAQCQNWLRGHLPHAVLVSVESTAAAARRCLHEPHAAAIGHCHLSSLLSLPILASPIEDEADNQTRFVVLAPQPVENPDADRTSVLFTLPDKPGSLARVLDLFARSEINLRKLESRPLRAEPWKYAFFADLECSLCKPDYAPVMQALWEVCASIRLLGCYTALGFR